LFSLIQRGQTFIDAEGWPVVIHSSTSHAVRFTRKKGGLRTVTIGRFNDEFERVDHPEYSKICAEIEQENNLKTLREMRRIKNC
jgi:hypothetical protein